MDQTASATHMGHWINSTILFIINLLHLPRVSTAGISCCVWLGDEYAFATCCAAGYESGNVKVLAKDSCMNYYCVNW